MLLLFIARMEDDPLLGDWLLLHGTILALINSDRKELANSRLSRRFFRQRTIPSMNERQMSKIPTEISPRGNQESKVLLEPDK